MKATTTYFDLSFSAERHQVGVLATLDALPEDTPLTRLLIYAPATDEWTRFDVEDIRLTSLVFSKPSFAVGDRGEVIEGMKKRSFLPDSGLNGRQLGQPNEIRAVRGYPFVCGYAGQFYRFDGKRWVHMDDGLAEPKGSPDSIDLESLDGTGPNDIWTVGSGGLVFHWNGKKWTRIKVPTNVYLARVRCFPDGRVFAVGDKGVVLEYDGRKWRADTIAEDEDLSLSDVAFFDGQVYVAGGKDLWVKRDDEWVPVKHGLPKKKTEFFRLDVGGDRLWAIGPIRLVSFDGQEWRSHPDPNNG